MAAAAPKQLLELFDLYWFTHEILSNTTKPHPLSSSSPSSSHPLHQNSEIITQVMTTNPSYQSRSFSGQSMSSTSGSFTSSEEDLSPSSVLVMPKLRTVLPGRVDQLGDENKQEFQVPIKGKSLVGGGGRRRRGRRGGGGGGGGSKSLSDLECEELKGFMDLGFVFSEEDRDSRLVSIIPGLQRLGGEQGMKIDDAGGEGAKGGDVSRPYLSEAWDVMEQTHPLMNWRLPDLSNEVDVKNQLRFWAHSVASSVR
ncbi:hypothetical protein Dimus_019888 [Dionaea muscipula]